MNEPVGPRPPVEINGTLLLAFAAACVNLQLYLTDEEWAFLGEVRPDGWYPLERFRALLGVVSGVYRDPAPVLSRLGAQMMFVWYHQGPGSDLVSGGVDFLRFQTGSNGYRSVIRGPESELGDFRLADLDERAGTARIDSTTPFPRDMEHGILLGGMRVAGDLPYVNVDLQADRRSFDVRFAPPAAATDDELADAAAASAGELRRLRWRAKGLEEELERERAFWSSTNATLVDAHRQVIENGRTIRALNRRITESVLNRYLPPEVVRELLANDVAFDEPRTQDVTVLFSDLVGFTRMADQIGAELTSEVLNDYLATMTEVVFDHLGTIDKFIGDGVMVLFGTPRELAPADQVERAAACALDMHVALAELNERLELRDLRPCRMRIGIAHGPVVVGNFGSRRRSDFTCVGTTVNVAARIQALCEPGSVLMTEACRAHLPDGRTDEAGSFAVRGIETPLSLYRLVQ